MRLAIFFGCLFYLLLGGYNYYYTAIHHNGSCYSPAQNIEKAHCTVIKETHSDKQEEYLITDEVEDEETNNLFARKYKLLAKCYLTLDCHLRDLYSSPKAPTAFYSPLSYKYITQGVLRI